ncbi:MAG: DMT family transporter [Burkholderiales bacterium]|nr:DMT family transporter [Burkholderiales bacterium]
MSRELKAYLILLTIPVMWGIAFPLMHRIVADYAPSLFVFWRFILAALIMSPLFISTMIKRKFNWGDVRYGLILGALNSGSFILQAMSLKYMDSSRAAFLTGINVVMVPFLLPLFRMGRPRVIEIVAALFCLWGIYLISGAGLHGGFGRGELLVILSALCIAVGIIFAEKSSLLSHNLKLLTFYQILFTSLIPGFILAPHNIVLPDSHLFWWAIVYCAIIATVIPFFLQIKYQRVIGSNKAAIIFSLESVTATFFAYWMGETIKSSVLIGGVVILFSTVLTDGYKITMKRIKFIKT